jgi:nicotinamidase-related amidase
MESAEGKKLPVPHCIKGTDGWQLNARIAAALEKKGYTPVEKLTFGSVELPGLIRNAAAGENFDVTLIGLCTDICVVSNALILKANFPEKEIIVDASCCAGVTPSTHNAALETMKMCQIQVN